jgi:hypothetical protein
MKRSSARVSLVLTLLTLLACTGPTLAQELPKDMVAFKATMSGPPGDVFVLPLVPPVLVARVSGTGQASELGAFTYVDSHTGHVDVQGAIQSLTDGIGVMTAANGDALFIRFSGLGQPTTNPPGVTAQMPYTVIGGKGRFQGAIGSGIIHAVFDADKKTLVYTLEGTISRPR